MPDKTLLISIDTEADWNAGDKLTYNNIKELYPLHNLFLSYNVYPTYLVTYDVADSDKCCEVINEICKNNDSEIGSHSHSWTTPPFKENDSFKDESNNVQELMLEIDDSSLYKKLLNLHNIILKNFNVEAKSHRAGRWGVGIRTLQWLEDNKYLCDSSIVPVVNPFKTIPSFYKLGKERSKAPNHPYFPSKNNIIKSSKENSFKILEIPLTGIYGNIFLTNYYFKGKTYVKKFFGYLNIKNYPNMSFRPSVSIDIHSFGKLVRNLFENGPDTLNFMFHSNELKVGCSPYSDNNENTKLIWDKIELVLELSKDYNIKTMTLKQYSEKVIKEKG
jgi:hypothetical protein